MSTTTMLRTSSGCRGKSEGDTSERAVFQYRIRLQLNILVILLFQVRISVYPSSLLPFIPVLTISLAAKRKHSVLEENSQDSARSLPSPANSQGSPLPKKSRRLEGVPNFTALNASRSPSPVPAYDTPMPNSPGLDSMIFGATGKSSPSPSKDSSSSESWKDVERELSRPDDLDLSYHSSQPQHTARSQDSDNSNSRSHQSVTDSPRIALLKKAEPRIGFEFGSSFDYKVPPTVRPMDTILRDGSQWSKSSSGSQYQKPASAASDKPVSSDGSQQLSSQSQPRQRNATCFWDEIPKGSNSQLMTQMPYRSQED